MSIIFACALAGPGEAMSGKGFQLIGHPLAEPRLLRISKSPLIWD